MESFADISAHIETTYDLATLAVVNIALVIIKSHCLKIGMMKYLLNIFNCYILVMLTVFCKQSVKVYGPSTCFLLCYLPVMPARPKTLS